jgi:hypothetical protein
MKVFRMYRILEVVIPVPLLFMAVTAASNGKLAGAAVFAGMAALVVLCFEARFWGHRRTIARVSRGLGEVGRRDLDAPVAVTQQLPDAFVEELASNGFLARMIANRSTRLCVTGTWRGRAVELGTAVVANRDFDSKLSYVCVLDQQPRGPFRVMTKGTMSSLARKFMPTNPVVLGDPTFDARWTVDGDARVARTVLDGEVRASLLALQAQLSWLQVVSIEATRFGLVVRWPGELSPDGAAYLRDLAFNVHDRLAAA